MLGSLQWKPYLDLVLKDVNVKSAGIFSKTGTRPPRSRR